jgi:4-carboxymuconolactone decarboxylase
MSNPSASGAQQGFSASGNERLPLPARDSMSDAQQAAADAIVNGPRKAIFGPFVPLLRVPELMEHIGNTGATLRFKGALPDAVRELVICVVAREVGNQFEWQTHAPLAVKAGVAPEAVAAIGAGRRPRSLPGDLACATDFASELMLRNGVSDAAYAEAVAQFGEAGTVELTALVGYFTMVCWVMNVARTPGPAGSQADGLTAFPA